MKDVLIVGSGVAGHSAARELSRLAPDLSVTIVGSEIDRPYDRPALSKQYLTAETADPPHLGAIEIYDDAVTLMAGTTATRIDCHRHVVTTSAGQDLPYDKLLLATGSRLRRLPMLAAPQERVLYLRTLDDARKLRRMLPEARNVAIVGGGFVGLELAAAARHFGCSVTVLERDATLLARVATPELSARIEALHRDNGVSFVFEALVENVLPDAGGVIVQWKGGELRADILIVGIGVVPNVELAEQAGIVTDNGIVVDCHCRTSDDSIFAAGEVTTYPVGRLGVHGRTESWTTALAQSVVAAANIAGHTKSFHELPWFWTDQYGVNIQCLGLPGRASHFFEVGDPGPQSWIRLGLDEKGRLVGAEGINAGRAISSLRRADRNMLPIPQELLDRSAIQAGEGSAAYG